VYNFNNEKYKEYISAVVSQGGTARTSFRNHEPGQYIIDLK
jgi:hypothetical protein